MPAPADIARVLQQQQVRLHAQNLPRGGVRHAVDRSAAG